MDGLVGQTFLDFLHKRCDCIEDLMLGERWFYCIPRLTCKRGGHYPRETMLIFKTLNDGFDGDALLSLAAIMRYRRRMGPSPKYAQAVADLISIEISNEKSCNIILTYGLVVNTTPLSDTGRILVYNVPFF